MCINIDPFAFGLLEYFFQVFEVMSRNKDSFPFLCSKRYFGRDRVAIRFRVCSIKQFHCFQVDLAAFQDQTEPFVEAKPVLDDLGERLVYEIVDRLILFVEQGGMIGIGTDAP